MAYRTRRRVTRKPAKKAAKRRYMKRSPAKRSSKVRAKRYVATRKRATGQGSAKTVRIVIEQPATSPVARPNVLTRIVRGPIL